MRNAVLWIGGVHACHIDQIGDHGRSRRLRPRALAVIQRRADGIALDQDGIHRPFNVGDQTLGRDQCRMHAQFDPFRSAPGNTQELDAVPQLFGMLDIGGIEFGDPFDVGLVELHRVAKGNRAHDGQLVRSIDSFDIEGRIGFGVSQALRFLEDFVKRQPLAAHLGENEIGGPVDDPGDPFDAIGSQALAQGFDDRNAASHRGFERDRHPFFLRRSKYFVAEIGQQGLVGCNHMLAALDGLEYEFPGHAITANQFDDDIDFRIDNYRKGVVRDPAAPAGHLARMLDISIGNDRNLNRPSRTPRNFLCVTFQHGIGSAADSANTQQSNVDRFHFKTFLKLYAETWSPSRK